MNSMTSLGRFPAGRALSADQITEFHAARLLLLVHVCGGRQGLQGLTKLAKLDFFVRYPQFFARAEGHFGQPEHTAPLVPADSAMVRHHYGPWDPRYYQVLAYLEARELLDVSKDGKAFVFSLTAAGTALAKRLDAAPSYQDTLHHMRAVHKLLGKKSGDALKKLVYELFADEVANLPLGKIIET